MLVYISLASFCSFLLNLNHFMDLGFHHMLERRIARLLSLFAQMILRLLDDVSPLSLFIFASHFSLSKIYLVIFMNCVFLSIYVDREI